MVKKIRQKSVFQAIEDVQGLTTMGLKVGRENILRFLDEAFIDHNALKVFHVAGSNGKGSVCQMISQVLYKGFGARVGLFTSPHLYDISERFQINGEQISHEDLNALYEWVLEQSERWGIPLSFFEIQVITAVKYFLDCDVDYAVFEVGLGGTYDGTNIWNSPLATYVVSICLEHTSILGKSWNTILKNKLGIAKKGVPIFTPYDNRTIRKYCESVGAHHHSLKHYPDERGLTNLDGMHQQKNAALVLYSLLHLGFDEEIVRKQLMNTSNPGRLHWVRENILVDTANTTQSLRALHRSIVSMGLDLSSLVLVFGSTQKNAGYCAQLANTIPAGGGRYLVQGFHRAHEIADYSQEVEDVIGKIMDMQSLEKIFAQDTQYLVCGSLFLVGEVMKMFRGKMDDKKIGRRREV